MDTPILFLAPEQYAGKTGIQRVDESGNVTALILDETGADVSQDGVSYRNA